MEMKKKLQMSDWDFKKMIFFLGARKIMPSREQKSLDAGTSLPNQNTSISALNIDLHSISKTENFNITTPSTNKKR